MIRLSRRVTLAQFRSMLPELGVYCVCVAAGAGLAAFYERLSGLHAGTVLWVVCLVSAAATVMTWRDSREQFQAALFKLILVLTLALACGSMSTSDLPNAGFFEAAAVRHMHASPGLAAHYARYIVVEGVLLGFAVALCLPLLNKVT